MVDDCQAARPHELGNKALEVKRAAPKVASTLVRICCYCLPCNYPTKLTIWTMEQWNELRYNFLARMPYMLRLPLYSDFIWKYVSL